MKLKIEKTLYGNTKTSEIIKIDAYCIKYMLKDEILYEIHKKIKNNDGYISKIEDVDNQLNNK